MKQMFVAVTITSQLSYIKNYNQGLAQIQSVLCQKMQNFKNVFFIFLVGVKNILISIIHTHNCGVQHNHESVLYCVCVYFTQD